MQIWISELEAQRFTKRIAALALIPSSGFKASLDIGVGGPEVPKAHCSIGIDSPSGFKTSLGIGAGPRGPQAHKGWARKVDVAGGCPESTERDLHVGGQGAQGVPRLKL